MVAAHTFLLVGFSNELVSNFSVGQQGVSVCFWNFSGFSVNPVISHEKISGFQLARRQFQLARNETS
jgi:hypothetical protein